jgi:branched-chain amino acid aminotransferase
MLQKFDQRNRDLLVNINGELIHRDKAGVSPFDSSVQGGDAVWEGLRLYHGRIFKLHEHLVRLRNSAQALAFTQIPSDAEIIEQIKRTLAANNMQDGVHLRLTLTRGVKITSGMDPRLNQSGPTLIVLAEHKAPVYATTGLSLITSKIRRPPPEILDPQIHHANLLNSILAKIEANNAGADDALMLDLQGFVAETNATHVFIVRDGEVATSFVRACPDGITRATVLEICAANLISCKEADLSLGDVYAADEMFCTGTMGELVAVTKVDGRTVGSGEVGPITKRLSELYRARTATEGFLVAGVGDPGRSKT